MKITKVHIELIKPHNGMIGFASLVINDSIYLSSIAIHKKLNSEGYRLTYPNKGSFTLFHPINRITSETIEKEVFIKLKDVLSKNVCQKNMTQD